MDNPLPAQKLYLGVMGGAGITNGFKNRRFYGRGSDSVHFADSKDFVLGATAEVVFHDNWSVEVDGLFRKLHVTHAVALPDGTLNSVSPGSAITWEFPVLAKYRFGSGLFRPFIEAGPSFRTTGNRNGSDPSHMGVAAGAGIETTYRGIRIAPVLRYTRWRHDNPRVGPQSKPDQLEALVGFSAAACTRWRAGERRWRLGALIGTGITPGFATKFWTRPGSSNITYRSGPERIIAGPSVEVAIARGIAVEVDALHRPYRFTATNIDEYQTRAEYALNYITWVFPLLAKYRLLPRRNVRPFVEAGPSFRLTQSLQYASAHGITAGGGVELRTAVVRLQPTVRYTHWGADEYRVPGMARRDQVEMLMGISF